MRTIKKIDEAVSAPVGDPVIFRVLSTNSIDHIDPFIFLNYQDYRIGKFSSWTED